MGKDAAIVLEDADLENAANQIVGGAFSYSGQRCTAIKRVLVVESVADRLAELLQAKVAKLTVGDPFDNTDITPVIDNASADFIWGLIEDAQEKEPKRSAQSNVRIIFIWPGLFDYVTRDMKLAWEEPFGPVLPLIRVADANEALEIANESEFGLQSSVFTNDFKKAFEIAENLKLVPFILIIKHNVDQIISHSLV